MPKKSARPPARKVITPKRLAGAIGTAIFIAVIVTIGVLNRSVAPASADAPSLSTIQTGDPAPNFSVQTTQGPFELAKAKRPVLLELFATWCPHCQHETAVLNSLYRRYGHSIDFVAVSASQYGSDRASAETLDDVLGFVHYFKVQYPVAFDSQLSTAKKYLLGGYPTIAVIEHGKVAYIGDGEISQAALTAQIKKVIHER